MKLTFTYAEIDQVREMLGRPEWCCALHTRLATVFVQVGTCGPDTCGPDGCGPGRPWGRPLYDAVRLTPYEINEFRDMLRRPEWCCALHTKMLDFLEREEPRLEMEAKCLAAYDAGDRTTLREVIEELK